LIHQLFSFSPIHSIRLYLFLTSLCSLYFCYDCLRKIFSAQESWGKLIILSLILFLFIILPLSEFGQRENLIVILTLPYFFSVTCRLQEKPVHFWAALCIGLLAGIGFCIKPFYLFSFLLVESYYLYHSKKGLRSILRIETLSIFLIGCFYLATILLFHSEYLYTVMPMATLFYYKAFSSPLAYLIINTLFYYCLFAIGFYFIQYKYLGAYSYFISILFLALSGFMLGYLLQRIPWYYHIYPAFALAILYFVVNYYVLLKNFSLYSAAMPILFGFCIFMWTVCARYYSTSSSLWYIHFFFILTLLCCSYYTWLKNSRYFKMFFLSALSLVFFTFPLCFFIQYFAMGEAQKSNLETLITLLQQKKNNKPIYFFSSMAAYMVSVLEHAHVTHASRLQFLAWMKCLYVCSSQDQHNKTYKEVNTYFIKLLADDISNNKPEWILVDEQKYLGLKGEKRIDYLSYLKQNAAFQSAWSPYHYLMSVKNPYIPYEYKIYVRG
jgi:hypothetical protein